MTKELLPICHFTEEGHDILRTNDEVREVVTEFWDNPQPEGNIGGQFLGAGTYSRVHGVGGIAIKVSSHTSSKYSYEEDVPVEPEDLTRQFRYLQALGEYLDKGSSGIRTPRQYFAMRSASHGYLHGQELLTDWEPLGSWAQLHYVSGDDPAYTELQAQLKARIQSAVADTALRHGLNDMRTKHHILHPGNVFVPVGSELSADVPLTIIDQPGLGHRFHARRSTAIT